MDLPIPVYELLLSDYVSTALKIKQYFYTNSNLFCFNCIDNFQSQMIYVCKRY